MCAPPRQFYINIECVLNEHCGRMPKEGMVTGPVLPKGSLTVSRMGFWDARRSLKLYENDYNVIKMITAQETISYCVVCIVKVGGTGWATA